MTSIAEEFKAEFFSLLTATLTFGVTLSNVRRTHRTIVTRDNAPAIHVFFQRATRGKEDACGWDWTLAWRVSVFVRDDAGDAAADPLVTEVVSRIGAMAEGGSGFTSKARVELTLIETLEDIADTDAIRVDIEGVAKYRTAKWLLDVAG